MAIGKHTLSYEVEENVDDVSGKVTTVVCHGHLVNETAESLREKVKSLIAAGGKIVVDLTDVDYVDSMGLGTLVGLKVSAVSAGFCTLEFVHLSKKLQEMVSLTHLTSMFRS